ncbi:hypothetical protein [Streptomyces lacrimifluminis]|uniref:hypothetical protein n=1 Tax=Streptomyces lacrimifluminis TaxID=1500077 RepID=UPI00166BBE33|nr:hypothetical protein [Streptomyces lacrimifluminis]
MRRATATVLTGARACHAPGRRRRASSATPTGPRSAPRSSAATRPRAPILVLVLVLVLANVTSLLCVPPARDGVAHGVPALFRGGARSAFSMPEA